MPADVGHEEVQGFILLKPGGELAPLSPKDPVAALRSPGLEGAAEKIRLILGKMPRLAGGFLAFLVNFTVHFLLSG